MKCPVTGKEHVDEDFDVEGLSTTGLCDCKIVRERLALIDFDHSSTPTEDGPEAHEDYGYDD